MRPENSIRKLIAVSSCLNDKEFLLVALAFLATVYLTPAAANDLIWTDTVEVAEYNCNSDGYDTIAVRGDVHIRPTFENDGLSEIRIKCGGLRFEENSELKTPANLTLLIEGEVCGPIKIVGIAGVDGVGGRPGFPGRQGIDGGDGEDGEDGADGEDGNDISLLARSACPDTTITMRSVGGNGGNGGNGGDGSSGGNGGNGGDGGNGGNGGDVMLAILEQDSALDEELDFDVSAGLHGAGGFGGLAGPGGTDGDRGWDGRGLRPPGRDGQIGILNIRNISTDELQRLVD